MRKLTETGKEVILNVDETYNYTSIIGRKINRTYAHLSDIINYLIKDKILKYTSKHTRKKCFKLTEIGENLKERMLQGEEIEWIFQGK